MFDFTKEIPLGKNKYKTYRLAQAGVYLVALGAATYLAYLTLFPSAEFNSTAPFVAEARGNDFGVGYDSGDPIADGTVEKNKAVIFDTALFGNFSNIRVSLGLNGKTSGGPDGKIELRKSYQAFLYPEGNPIGFKDGTLLKNNGNYYLVSEGNLRKFQAPKTASDLGFPDKAFIETSNDEMKYNPAGDDIADSKSYPNDSIFKIEDSYYILKSQTLRKFISQAAFLSQYDDSHAIRKDRDFLANFQLSDKPMGFSDASLIAYGTSGFVVSGDQIIAISNAETFQDQGFDWNDIKNVSGDEFSLYTQSIKHFSLSSAHPDGTVFFTNDTKKWYVIFDGQKHLLPSEKIASVWLKGKSAITVSSEGSNVLATCAIQKGFSGKTYCQMNIPSSLANNLPGIDYQFRLITKEGLSLSNLDILFKQDMTKTNLKSSILGLIHRIKLNYGIIQ